MSQAGAVTQPESLGGVVHEEGRHAKGVADVDVERHFEHVPAAVPAAGRSGGRGGRRRVGVALGRLGCAHLLKDGASESEVLGAQRCGLRWNAGPQHSSQAVFVLGE